MPFTLTHLERATLKRLARTAQDARLRRRVQALLDLHAGASPALVARRHQVTRATIYNWISRLKDGACTETAFHDRPRPGRPRLDGAIASDPAKPLPDTPADLDPP